MRERIQAEKRKLKCSVLGALTGHSVTMRRDRFVPVFLGRKEAALKRTKPFMSLALIAMASRCTVITTSRDRDGARCNKTS